MKTLIAAVIFLGIAVLFLCFNIIFRKDKSFPDGEIGHIQELRKRGIICAREDEMKLWKKRRKRDVCSGCNSDCFFKTQVSQKQDISKEETNS